jgi:LysR family glycine cleavage system transcriptional activator
MHLPPLNSVRAFEAAGRLENFSAAAGELNVTPGAVSRQIKKLEQHLGISLFRRVGNEVQITDIGRRYLVHVQDAFGKLETGTLAIGADNAAQRLQIWGSRFFIRLWLLPRLPEFHARFPGQEVSITTVRPDAPLPPEIDVAIVVGEGNWPSMRADLLMKRVVMPVCSPNYLRSAPPLTKPDDLAHHTLLETSAMADDWDRWSASTGSFSLAQARRITFTSADLTFSAALDGLGVVLGRCGVIENELHKGNLVAPIEGAFDVGDGFYLVYQDRDPLPARVQNFRRWISEQLAI